MKRPFFYFFILLVIYTCTVQCKRKIPEKIPQTEKDTIQLPKAQFQIETHSDTLFYLPFKEAISRVKIPKSNLPLNRLVVLSSSATAYLDALNSLDKIITVYGAEYIYNPKIHQLINNRKIRSGGAVAGINLEEIVAHQPDAVITYSDPTQNKLYRSIQQMGIPVIFINEFNEQHPLNKTEYLQVFGELVGKKGMADSLINDITLRYNQLKTQAKETTKKPTVFTEIMRSDIWYMPGGNSFISNYLKDAGSHYIWANTASTSAIPLNFEQVLSQAENAEFWLNASDFSSRKELENAFKGHALFNSFKKDNVYNYIKRKNKQGANDFFETGTVRADWVLKDLIQIFHPDVLPKDSLYFYKRIP